MQFIKSSEAEDWQKSRHVSEDGKWQLYIYPVLFGFRVRVGRVGEGVDLIDYCCRDDFPLLAATFAVCKKALEDLSELSEQAITEALPSRGEDKLFRNPWLMERLGLNAFIPGAIAAMPPDLKDYYLRQRNIVHAIDGGHNDLDSHSEYDVG